MAIQTEVLVFIFSCLLGGFFSFYYDCFRLFRQIIPHHGILVFFEDIFYFATCSIIAFSFIVEKSSGGIRGFLFVGFVLGFVLYFFTISVVFMKFMRLVFIVFDKCFCVILKILLLLLLPFKLIFRIFHYFFTKLFGFLCVIVRKCKKISLKSNLT